MRMHRSITRSSLFALVSFISIASSLADEPQTKRELSDAELDQVTAGAARYDEATDEIVFDVARTTRSGNSIQAEGSMKLLDAADFMRATELNLSDNAQQNLSSLVNINAIDSQINVLLNLSITINSTVGEINQLNLAGSLPMPAGVTGM